nr:transcription termination/antitermination NusG family protein [Nitrosomonas nitrosa]
MHWYVVCTKPNQEKQASLNIGRLGVGCFLPLLQEQKIIRRKLKTITTPLFPGYLFVRINVPEHYRAVIYTRGVQKIVEFGSGPVEVDSAVIDAIRSRMPDSDVYVLDETKGFGSGQPVQIKDGPLGGLEAVFMRELPGRQRAIVLLRALAFQARAVVGVDQLVPCLAA